MEILIKTPVKDDYQDAMPERNPHGVIILDGQEVANTLMCPHCGMHFVSRRGSGARRGYCYHCAAVTCGNPACDGCRPLEKQLEAIERKATQAMRGL